jgi:hypothetical protein
MPSADATDISESLCSGELPSGEHVRTYKDTSRLLGSKRESAQLPAVTCTASEDVRRGCAEEAVHSECGVLASDAQNVMRCREPCRGRHSKKQQGHPGWPAYRHHSRR